MVVNLLFYAYFRRKNPRLSLWLLLAMETEMKMEMKMKMAMKMAMEVEMATGMGMLHQKDL